MNGPHQIGWTSTGISSRTAVPGDASETRVIWYQVMPRIPGKGQASRVPLSSADRHIRDIYRLAVQSVAEMGLQGGFTGL